MPLVSVIMGVYNGERYLKPALNSVLSQTFTDFEFIIVDDASTDASAQVIRTYDDPRIQFIQHSLRRGLAATLNHALALATGDYIARMDADDVSLSTRFDQQIAFLQTQLDVGCVGVGYAIIDGNGNVRGLGRANTDAAPTSDFLRWRLLWGPPLAHPGWMLRRTILEQHNLQYDTAFDATQDYDLLCRLAHHAELGLIPEVLLHYRRHQGTVSTRLATEQYQNHCKISRAQLNHLPGRHHRYMQRGLPTSCAVLVGQPPTVSGSTMQFLAALQLLQATYQSYFHITRPDALSVQQIQRDVRKKAKKLTCAAWRAGAVGAVGYGLGLWAQHR